MRKHRESRPDKGMPLILSILVVFFILGTIVFTLSQRISTEMSSSAINNLSESLDLVKGTLEAILTKEAEFQKLIAKEVAMLEQPEEFIRSYNRNRTMVLSLIHI